MDLVGANCSPKYSGYKKTYEIVPGLISEVLCSGRVEAAGKYKNSMDPFRNHKHPRSFKGIGAESKYGGDQSCILCIRWLDFSWR